MRAAKFHMTTKQCGQEADSSQGQKNDDRIIVPKTLRYAALNVLHFGHSEINNMRSNAAIIWLPNMRSDMEQKSKT